MLRCTLGAAYCWSRCPSKSIQAGPNAQHVLRTKNHSTQDSHVVPHHGTNWAALRLTAQIGRDAVLSKSYGRGYKAEYGHGSYAGL